MTLDEAILHCQDKAAEGGSCAEQYSQLAGWLIELKELRQGKFVGSQELLIASSLLPVTECHVSSLAYIASSLAIPGSFLCTQDAPADVFDKMEEAFSELALPEAEALDFSVSYGDYLKGHQRKNKRSIYSQK